MNRKLFACVLTWTGLMATSSLAAKVDRAQLAKETEIACAATAKDKVTPDQVVAKINAAAALIEAEGPAAYPKFMGKDSQFLFGGTYIWIHDMDGTMQMHPIKYKMEGNALLGLKDSKGKLFFVEMNKAVREKGAGWVEYFWPKPGEKEYSQKISYVKGATHKGTRYILGCGIYDVPPTEAARLVSGH